MIMLATWQLQLLLDVLDQEIEAYGKIDDPDPKHLQDMNDIAEQLSQAIRS